MQQHDRNRDSARTHSGWGYAEDFTGAFLVSFGALLFVAFFVIASLLGWLVVFLTFWASDSYLKILAQKRRSEDLSRQPGRKF